ncbi:MAG: protein translocase subunit SecD [Candidatus Sungbacteria bacterium]|uniref:Protein translocase subunit SecD n=1 Tax=Candidatus Sungiibacteriota bacterium TaxID=2750080 RepID=A0A931SCG6_9BACT|nr:protein translocase subunit SecD [Candidatus Sungbacteria bacterium]
MAASSRQKTYSITKRRIAAVFLLLGGLFLGIYDGAAFWNRYAPPSLQLRGALAEPYHLGLDLQGGTHLVYQADFSAVDVENSGEAMQGLRDIIERRVNAFGVAEPVVQVNRVGDNWRLIVELAGIKDTEAAIRYIGATPLLEFREPQEASSTEQILAAQAKGELLGEDPYFLPARLTGRYLKRAAIEFDSNTNVPLIGVEFNDEGAKLFEEMTKNNVGRPIGIYIDGIRLSDPIVQETISGGKAVITGQFTLDYVKDMVRNLNSGALPVPITLVSQQTVEASLGKASLEASLRAALIGLLVVALFMILWYRLPGVLAVFALLVYTAMILAIFKLIGLTFTVAAIAGFVLSIGMAVDANILIFERMKEELRRGQSLPDAVTEGFSRAWTSIRDSNISSLITAGILYWLGTSMIRGFALTLAIGILVSMFTALTVSRTFLIATLRNWHSRILYLSGFSR